MESYDPEKQGLGFKNYVDLLVELIIYYESIGIKNSSGAPSEMVDSMMTLSVEERDPDLRGCRVLQMQKNRFGGAGGTFFLELSKRGFKEVARVSAA